MSNVTTSGTSVFSSAGLHERNSVIALLVLTVILLIILILLPCIVCCCLKTSWHFRYWLFSKPVHRNHHSDQTRGVKQGTNKWRLRSREVQTEITYSSIESSQIVSSARTGWKAGYHA